MTFHEIKASDLTENIFNLIGKDWFLMSAEKDGRVNPMTVSWATAGILWQKNVEICAVRPERFTCEFLDAAETFSLTVFDKTYRKMLAHCGTISGRDEDKVVTNNLTVVHDGETPYFEEARLAFICRKIAVSPLTEADFLGDKEFTSSWYGGENQANGHGGGYHLFYIAEIEKVLEKDK